MSRSAASGEAAAGARLLFRDVSHQRCRKRLPALSSSGKSTASFFSRGPVGRERTGTRRRSDWEIDSLASRPTSTHKREVWIYKQKRRSHLQHPPPEPLFHLREHLRNLYNFTVSDRYMGGQVEKKVAEHNNNNLLFVIILLYRLPAA